MSRGLRLSLMCQAATEGTGWAALHTECPGPTEITIPGAGGGTVRLHCDCPCHQNQENDEAMRRCHYCPEDAPPPTADLASVGFLEQGSGGGCIYYACPPCLKEHDLVPLAEHPPGTFGRVLTRTALHAMNSALPCVALLLALMMGVARQL